MFFHCFLDCFLNGANRKTIETTFKQKRGFQHSRDVRFYLHRCILSGVPSGVLPLNSQLLARTRTTSTRKTQSPNRNPDTEIRNKITRHDMTCHDLTCTRANNPNKTNLPTSILPLLCQSCRFFVPFGVYAVKGCCVIAIDFVFTGAHQLEFSSRRHIRRTRFTGLLLEALGPFPRVCAIFESRGWTLRGFIKLPC